MTREDDALARVLLGGKHVDEAALDRAKRLLKEKHPRRDLAHVLLQYGIVEKETLAVAQRLAKMAKPTARPRRSPGEAQVPSSRDDDTDEPPAADAPPKAGEAAAPADAPPEAPVEDAPAAPAPADAARDAKPPSATAEPPATAEAAPADPASLPTPLMTPRVDPPRVKRFTDRTRFGRYEVVEKIAKGGMGVVYKVRHPGLDRLFALKVLSQGEDADDEVLERFRREAKTAARLDHPAIVRVHDAGTEDGFPYLVMDLVDGESLARILKDEGVAPRKGALVARAIAHALAHAHEKGVVHRDVKPDNVLIDRASGEARLSDFGIVKDLEGDGDAKLTKTGLTLGSPCYMSPEQAAGRHKDVGPQSDVYSLGATLYEMLAGKPPFDGESIHAIMVKVVHDDPVPPRRSNPAVHPDLEAICLKCLEKDPRRRYANATELAADLDRFLDGKPVVAKPAGVLVKLVRSAKRHRAAAVSTVVLASVVAWVAGAEVAARSRARREQRARIELELQSAELALSRAARPDLPEMETRRAYRDAIRCYDRVLEDEPGSPRAKEGKLRAVLGLADRLLERREPGFAEFVLDQADGLGAEAAVIASKRELARKSEWIARAEAAELKGELDEAVRLLREGLRALREAGLTGELLETKIAELEKQIAARKREEDAKVLIDSGERSESGNDLVAALDSFRQALVMTPGNASLAARIQLLEARVRRLVEQALDDAMTEADRAKATLPPGAVSRPDLTTQLEQGAQFGRTARDRAQRGDFAAALDAARNAQQSFRRALDVASALAAREDVRAAREELRKNPAASYAESEIRLGKAKEDSGESQLAASEYAAARADFVEAATYYRLATNRGEIKQAVSAARETAREAKTQAQKKLPLNLTLKVAHDAEALEADARRAEVTDLVKARELWARAAVLWKKAEEIGPAATEALAAREKARLRKLEADAELASEYDPTDVESARSAMDDGDGSLAREDFEKASERYAKADYFWKQAATKSAPQSRPRRRIEALRRATDEARLRARAKDKQGTRRYDEADHYVSLGEDAEKRRYWRGAEDYYTRAKNIFDELAPPDR